MLSHQSYTHVSWLPLFCVFIILFLHNFGLVDANGIKFGPVVHFWMDLNFSWFFFLLQVFHMPFKLNRAIIVPLAFFWCPFKMHFFECTTIATLWPSMFAVWGLNSIMAFIKKYVCAVWRGSVFFSHYKVFFIDQTQEWVFSLFVSQAQSLDQFHCPGVCLHSHWFPALTGELSCWFLPVMTSCFSLTLIFLQIFSFDWNKNVTY